MAPTLLASRGAGARSEAVFARAIVIADGERMTKMFNIIFIGNARDAVQVL